MGLRPGLATVLVFSILLAGCGGKKDGAGPATTDAPTDLPVLSGYVLDPAIAPVEGATVSVHGTNATSMTFSDGSYAFEEVPVGMPIIVIVELDGFVTASKSVTIPEESTMVLNFTLSPVP